MKKLKVRHKMLICVGVFALLFTVFMCVVCHDTTIDEGSGNLNGKYMTVLANIDGIVEANPRYVDIAMLASHDAVTDSIGLSTPIDLHDEGGALDIIEPISAGMQYRFSKTQAVSIGKQLAQGSRFFHIKCTDYYGTWYGTHTHLCNILEKDILEVLEYLSTDSAKGEIVTLLFQPMHFCDGSTLDSMYEDIDAITHNGKSLFDYVYTDKADSFDNGSGGVRIGELTYNQLTKDGTEPGVVILTRREEGTFKQEWEGNGTLLNKTFDMDSCSEHEWHSSIGTNRLIKKINAVCDKIANDSSTMSKLRLNQSQASLAVGSIGELFDVIGNWSLLRFANKHNLKLLENDAFDRWLTYMPVFQVDFCNSDKGDFNNRVNARIHEYNQKVVNEILSAD